MLNLNTPFILASKSPRRNQLLKKILNDFQQLSEVEFSEEINDSLQFNDKAIDLAVQKMNQIKHAFSEGIILTADTIVVKEDILLGKPIDKDDAYEMLKSLSGIEHEVITGYCLLNRNSDSYIKEYVSTKVKFRNISDDEIFAYIKTGNPMDKAGAYGIQDDYGSVFIESINGCYYNVVGLPLSKLYQSIKEIV